MKLNLHSIYECLPSTFKFIKLIETNKNKQYDFPKLFSNETKIEDDALYIGVYEDFPSSIFENDTVAIICTNSHLTLKPAKCNLLQISSDISISQIFSSVAEIYYRYNTWENEVLKVLACHGNLKELIQITKPLFGGNQLNCINLKGEILAGTIGTSLLNKNTYDKKHLPLSMLAQNIDQVKPSLKKGESQSGTCHIENTTFNFIQRNIYMTDESIGLVNCTDTNHPIKEVEHLLLDQLCNLIEDHLTEGFLLKSNTSAKASNLLKCILEGKHTKSADLAAHFSKMELQEKYSFTCLCLHVLDNESGNILSKFFSANLHHYLPNSILCTLGSNIVILLYSTNINEHPKMIECFKELLKGCTYELGISNSFYNIENVKYYYEQSLIAINVQYKTADNSLYFFSDHALSYIINQATSELPFQHLCHPGIMALYEYDQSSSTEYINTLKVYFENEQNTVRTAELLFIHRSTLLYRLERIKKIINDNWDSHKKRLYIMLSLYMLEEKTSLHNNN